MTPSTPACDPKLSETRRRQFHQNILTKLPRNQAPTDSDTDIETEAQGNPKNTDSQTQNTFIKLATKPFSLSVDHHT